jgi:hypothetical protein
MESLQLLLTALIRLAGPSRLPTKLNINDEVISEQEILQNMETSIQEYMKSYTNFKKDLHDDKMKAKMLNDIKDIISQHPCSINNAYLKLWENFLTNVKDNKVNLELMNTIMTKMTNKKLKNSIELANKTPTKINNSVKTILNTDSPFVSIFVPEELDKLDKKEQLIQKNIIQNNLNHTNRIDTFLGLANFEKDEDLNISSFYNNIRKVSDPQIRNQYYNMYMTLLISPKIHKDEKKKEHPLMIKIGTTWKLSPIDTKQIKIREHILISVYIYFINNEKVKKLDDIVKKYFELREMKWITYQINEFSNKLHPNSPFRLPGFNLDPWQKDTIKAINDKKNILLSLPTSAGKTILSTYTFKAWSKVIFCSPNEAPSYQLTGITLASLDDINDSTKNVRQETNNFTFKKYPAQPDNIIISTPVELYNMILNKSVDLNVDYIIFDEFHNVTDDILGPYIEFIFKTAAYYNIPIMALSATIPNFLEVKLWMEKLTKKEIFGIYEKKRFFNQKRFYIKDGKLNQINPLEHITKETLMDPTFTQIGLYPKEIISLRDNVQKLKHNDNLVTDESIPDMLTLDKLHILEGKIFDHLKNSPEIHDQIFDTNKTDLIPENITVYGLFKIMKECKDKKMLPLLAFKFDSQHC